MTTVVATVDVTPDRRASFERILGDRARLVVLSDLGGGEREAALERADVILCAGFVRDLPEDPSRLRNLKLVQTLSAGVDHLPWDRIPPSATVCSNAGAYNVSIGEHAMALLLAAAKHVPFHTGAIRQGEFRQDRPSRGLRGRTLGVLGLGGIGGEVARLGKAFGMRVVGISRSGRTTAPADFVGTADDLERVLRESDYVLVALPHTVHTDGLIGRRELAWMKPDAVLVNVSRGKVVVEDDLYEHVRTHPDFTAALDVWWLYPRRGEGRPFTRPFHELPNVVMTPHVAFHVPEQRLRSMEHALENVRRYLDGEPLRNVVDRADYVGLSRGP